MLITRLGLMGIRSSEQIFYINKLFSGASVSIRWLSYPFCIRSFEKWYPFHIPTQEHCIPFPNPWNAVNERCLGRRVLPEEMLTKKQYYYLREIF